MLALMQLFAIVANPDVRFFAQRIGVPEAGYGSSGRARIAVWQRCEA